MVKTQYPRCLNSDLADRTIFLSMTTDIYASALAKAFNLNTATIFPMLKKLEREGVIKRKDSNDSRVYYTFNPNGAFIVEYFVQGLTFEKKNEVGQQDQVLLEKFFRTPQGERLLKDIIESEVFSEGEAEYTFNQKDIEEGLSKGNLKDLIKKFDKSHGRKNRFFQSILEEARKDVAFFLDMSLGIVCAKGEVNLIDLYGIDGLYNEVKKVVAPRVKMIKRDIEKDRKKVK